MSEDWLILVDLTGRGVCKIALHHEDVGDHVIFFGWQPARALYAASPVEDDLALAEFGS